MSATVGLPILRVRSVQNVGKLYNVNGNSLKWRAENGRLDPSWLDLHSWGADFRSLQEGEGVPEQGPQPLRAPGVFLDFLEPRLEPLRASIRAP